MQNIDLICVGKLNAPYFAAGVAESVSYTHLTLPTTSRV